MKLIVAAAFLFMAFQVRAADWILAADTVEVRPGATVTLEVLYAGAGQEKFPDRGRGSIQADASYPLRRELVGGIGGYWHVQYFNGYGEDLLGYNQKRDAQLRVGFSIVR